MVKSFGEQSLKILRYHYTYFVRCMRGIKQMYNAYVQLRYVYKSMLTSDERVRSFNRVELTRITEQNDQLVYYTIFSQIV